jgi:hypothetical protein
MLRARSSITSRAEGGQVTRISRHGATLALGCLVALASAHTVLALTAAADDAYTIDEDTQLDLADLDNPQPTLLANDTNDGGMPCVASSDTTGLTGTIDTTLIVNGIFKYTPPPDWNGQTTFTYVLGTVADQSCPAVTPEAIASVTITVTPVNDPPTAVADSFTALKDRTLNVGAPGVLINDSDVDGDLLTAVKVTSPSHGVATLASDGSFSYTPKAGYVGPDAFSYKASDGTALSSQKVVSLSVVAVPPVSTPTAPPTPRPVPTESPTPEPSPSESPAPSDSGFVTASVGPSDSAPASPTAGAVGGPVSGQGSPPLIAIGALLLLVGLLAVAAVYFVRSQRAGEEEDLEPAVDGDFDDGPVDEER